MNWLSPNFLLAACAIGLPLALHLLRRRITRTVPFPSLRFLAPKQPRSRRTNLQRRIVLALRCLVLALLAAAFARPFFGQPPNANGAATIVVIDNSFSLQTTGRWSLLRDWARDQIGRPSDGDTIGLLLMNPQPTWLVPPSRDTAATLAMLDEIKPGWETTRAEPALRLAADTLAASTARSRKLIWLGDHQASGWTGADFTRKLPPGVVAAFPEVPPAPAKQAALLTPTIQSNGSTIAVVNPATTNATANSSATATTASTIAATVTVQVRNFTAAQTRTLRAFAGDETKPFYSKPLELAAGAIETVRVDVPSDALSKSWIRLALDADDLPADDVAYVLTPSATASRRMLLLDRVPATAEADHAGTACLTFSTLAPTMRVAGLPNIAWPAGAAVILRNDTSFTAETATRLNAFLNAGGSVFVFVDGGKNQLDWLAAHGVAATALPEGEARIRDWEIEHPLVAPLAKANLRSLVGWSFNRGWSLPPAAVEPLAFWADGTPALGELKVGAGRLLVAGFTADRRDGSWPLAPAFVPFLHRVALHLLDSGAPVADAALPKEGTWRALAGSSVRATLAAGPSSTALPAAPGIYEHTLNTTRTLFALNVPPEESDPAAWAEGTPWKELNSTAPAPASAFKERRELAVEEAEQQSPLWWWCFAAMGVFVIAEIALANRTPR